MASAREHIRTLVASGDTFDQPAEELRERQLDAAREAFAAHRERIPLLRTRSAGEDGSDSQAPAAGRSLPASTTRARP